MAIIKYKIEFFSNWHCSSGLAAGADVDTLVIKDDNNLPFIPGRTIKGLLRDAMRELIGYNDLTPEKINELFGYNNDKDSYYKKGCVSFTNATLDKSEINTIVKNNLSSFLYKSFTSTAIDENGIAKDSSLRSIETVVPCVLHAILYGVPEESETYFENAFKYIKRLGLGRNRGYGRCKISIDKDTL